MGKHSKKKKEEGKFANALDWILDFGELAFYAVRGLAKLISKILN